MIDVGVGLLYLGLGLLVFAIGAGAVSAVIFGVVIGRRILHEARASDERFAKMDARFEEQRARVDDGLGRSSGRII